MSFSAPPVRASFHGFLFDMDGTVIDSTAAVEKHWENVGKDIGVDPEVILQTSHGRRSIDMLRVLAPEKANWEFQRDKLHDVQHMEGLLPKLYGDDAVEIPGARALLKELGDRNVPWAIVTSGTVPLVTGWLKRLELPRPEHLVTAESVQNGKPDPACYRMGRERIALEGGDRNVLVLEDAPAGIRAGKAAGCKVLGLVTSHTAEQVKDAQPDWIVKDLESVKIVDYKDGLVTLEFSDGLVDTTKENGNGAAR